MKIHLGRNRFPFPRAAIPFLLLSQAIGQLPTARIAVTQGRLDTICGTHNVKLVFMCKNYGYFVDFSEATPQIRQMTNVTNSFFPVISSDGKSITYQSGIEAEGPSTSSVPGKVWFRELALNGTPVKLADTGYVPRFVQNAPADTPAIVYATSVACPKQLCYSAGQTVLRRIVNKSPLPVETLFAGGSYYGGLSWDNRYLITGWPGGPNGFMLDLQNAGAGPRAVHTMRVRKIGTDADTLVSVGTCNISRSASKIFTNTMLYYDFGSAAVEDAHCYHPVLGSWPEHALLFISRYDSEDLKTFKMPADRKIVSTAVAQGLGEAVWKEWYYPEWSNHPYFAAAGLNIDRLWLKGGNWEHTYNTESIYLVGLKDSTYVKLIESTDTAYASSTNFIYPWVWVEKPAGFEEDPAWLTKTIWQSIAVKKPKPKRSVSGKVNLSDPLITGISLFDLSGVKIMTLSPAPGLTLEKVRKLAGPGNYLIGISRKGKPREYIRIAEDR